MRRVISRKRLNEASHVRTAEVTIHEAMKYVLGQGLTLSLQQAVTCLGTLELGLHQAQGLPCRKDGLAILSWVSISRLQLRGLRQESRGTHCCPRHGEGLLIRPTRVRVQ